MWNLGSEAEELVRKGGQTLTVHSVALTSHLLTLLWRSGAHLSSLTYLLSLFPISSSMVFLTFFLPLCLCIHLWHQIHKHTHIFPNPVVPSPYLLLHSWESPYRSINMPLLIRGKPLQISQRPEVYAEYVIKLKIKRETIVSNSLNR